MPDDTDRLPPLAPARVEVRLSDSGSAQAPFVYFDRASVFGHNQGVIKLTLEAERIFPNSPGSGTATDRVIVAHLRMGLAAAKSLKAAIDGALLMAAPTQSETKN